MSSPRIQYILLGWVEEAFPPKGGIKGGFDILFGQSGCKSLRALIWYPSQAYFESYQYNAFYSASVNCNAL